MTTSRRGASPRTVLDGAVRVAGALALLFAAFSACNVLVFRAHTDALVYAANGLVLLLAAFATGRALRIQLPHAVQQRLRLWVLFLACYGMSFLWPVLDSLRDDNRFAYVQIWSYAGTYAFAFLAVVSPPTGRRWNLDWLLDILQAAILSAMFAEAALYLNRSLSHALFDGVLKAFLCAAASFARRNARGREERALTATIALYFAVETLLSLFSNLATSLSVVWAMRIGDIIYPAGSAVALVCASRLGRRPVRVPSFRVHTGQSVPVMPLVTTSAILLLCIPIFRVRITDGFVLMGCALLLFGARISLLLHGHQRAEHTLVRDNQELRRLALTDPLTGIANRRAFTDALRQAVHTAATTGPAFTLVLMDLDHLKEINDTLGHVAGDRIIQLFASTLVRFARLPFDHAGRLGGDEFGVILPPGQDAALWVAELKELLGIRGVRFCAGCRTCTLTMRLTPEQLMEAADRKLYAEKQRRPGKSAGVTVPSEEPQVLSA